MVLRKQGAVDGDVCFAARPFIRAEPTLVHVRQMPDMNCPVRKTPMLPAVVRVLAQQVEDGPAAPGCARPLNNALPALPEDPFARVIEASPSALVMVGPDGTIEMVNRQAERIFGYERQLMLGQALEILLPERHRSRHPELRGRFLTDASVRPMGVGRELFGMRQDGSEFPVEIGLNPIEINGKTMLLAAVLDITERRRAERHIQFLAYHDALTGLANRAVLNDHLSQALAHAKRDGTAVAVLTLDLDRFKFINDAYGHAAGDRVLVAVAERLRNAVRASDTVARTGGDEFVIVMWDFDRPAVEVEVARRVVAMLSAPIDIGDRAVTIGGSVGIALFPADGETVDELLQSSDVGLYRAKAQGGSTFRLYSREMDREVRERSALAQDLREAIGTDQLNMHFQAQFTTDTLEITGFEALLRWQHPVKGHISPAVMIPLAEASRLILRLGTWIIEASCTAAMGWPVPHRVAVNLSAAQFRDGDLPGIVADILRRTGLPAGRLELEVTESLLIEDTEVALTVLRSLKKLGVTIALDDFGTGYSSLSYLRMFPFDKIKIDKSFIGELDTDPGARSIVGAILAMGRNLDMDVIAEGIETEQQLAIMRRLCCPEIQGFLLGKPMPGEPGIGRQPASRRHDQHHAGCHKRANPQPIEVDPTASQDRNTKPVEHDQRNQSRDRRRRNRVHRRRLKRQQQRATAGERHRPA
jgi:diguanylate cyclase (GGDEF)-like protein/PAS domain S-box-containing protein